jgi:hypothetical protein
MNHNRIFFSILILLTTPFVTYSQVLYSYVKTEKPSYCLKDSLYSNSIIGRKVKIWHDGGIYSTINTTSILKWPSEEIKSKSGKSGWKEFIPKAGDTGTVVYIFYDKKSRRDNIYLIKIRENYVPIGCNYLTDINQLDAFENDYQRAIQDSLENVQYSNGCKFKLRNINETWSRAGLANIDIVSENFACDLISKGIDTVLLCKYIFDNGSLPIEKGFIVWLENGQGFVKAYFNNSKHKPRGNKVVEFDSRLLINHFFKNRLDTVKSEPKSDIHLSHSLGYCIQLYTKDLFFRERITDFLIRQDKNHPKSIWWKLVSDNLEKVKED